MTSFPSSSLGTFLLTKAPALEGFFFMEPIFTLPWPEFVIAEKLQELLRKKLKPNEEISILIPLSRQEKGIDLAILKTAPSNMSSATTIQVKASRTYPPKENQRKNIFQYTTWFNSFRVPERADFIILVGMYSEYLDSPGKGAIKRYRYCSLLFTIQEMAQFFEECKLRKSEKQDRKFSFGFDADLKSIILTRGDSVKGRQKDFAGFLLEKRLDDIKRKLNGEQPIKTVPMILE
jgi:hypothetical protein